MKKYIINDKDADRALVCKAKLSKPVVRDLYWFFEPVGDNVPLKFLPRADRAGFTNGNPRLMTTTGEDGLSEHRKFRVSVCGLDKFKVFASLKRDGSDKKEVDAFEVWRKLYYSISYMDPSFKFATGPVHDEYKRHGIWLIEVAPGSRARSGVAGQWHNQAPRPLPAGGKVPHDPVIETREAGLDLVPDVTHRKLEARLVLVDRMWISSWQGYGPNLNGTSVTYRFPKDVWPVGTFVRGTVKGISGTQYPIAPFASRVGLRRIKFDFTGPAATEAANGPLRLTFQVKFRDKVLNGTARSGDGRIVIASRTVDPGLRDALPRQITMTHEIGHGFGMVVTNIQEYNEYNGNPIAGSNPANPTYYQNGGGHCSTAAGGSAPNFTDGSCVIFHYENDNRKIKYCGSCSPIVRRTNLDREGMLWPEKY